MSQRKDYENAIVNHPNYAFMPDELRKNWVAVSKAGVNPRKSYWDKKLSELIEAKQLPSTSTLANLAKYIHPTKKHVCKQCNKESSIYYEYPNANTWKWLKKTFNVETNSLTIFEIYEQIPDGLKKEELFTKYFGMPIKELETACKSDTYTGKKLSPGVMSNPPDRLDGFHCLNLCCRKECDKGRSDDNMKAYGRDRRAYELWSDGNCLLANALMGELNKVQATCYVCGSEQMMTGDHIGPISLGFIHDPANFQACCGPCNSTKNNRLTQDDVNKIKALELKGTPMLSWWAKPTWEKYKNSDILILRKRLDMNVKKFITVMEWLKADKQTVLEEVLTQSYMNHGKSYKIAELKVFPNGDIMFNHTEAESTKKTKAKQYANTLKILLETCEKNNRKVSTSLNDEDIVLLSTITLEEFKHVVCRVLEGDH